MDDFTQAAIHLQAVTDQFLMSAQPLLKTVGQYHATCVEAGIPVAVADEMALRFAARVCPLPPRQADTCWDSTTP